MKLENVLGMFQGSPQLAGIMQMAKDKVQGRQAASAELAPQAAGGIVGATGDATMASSLGEINLVLRVLVELLLSKGLLNHDEFRAKIDEVDLRDGRADGKLG